MKERMEALFKEERHWKRSVRIIHAQAQLKAAKGNDEEVAFWKAVIETHKRPKYWEHDSESS